jgi:hypothetical protein
MHNYSYKHLKIKVKYFTKMISLNATSFHFLVYFSDVKKADLISSGSLQHTGNQLGRNRTPSVRLLVVASFGLRETTNIHKVWSSQI